MVSSEAVTIPSHQYTEKLRKNALYVGLVRLLVDNTAKIEKGKELFILETPDQGIHSERRYSR